MLQTESKNSNYTENSLIDARVRAAVRKCLNFPQL